MTILAFKITLLEPALMMMLGSGDANQLDSFDFIPGSVIRNALAAQYIKEQQLTKAQEGNAKKYNAAHDSVCRGLFFSNRVRFLNAYPLAEHNQPTLPVPCSWRAGKNDLAEFNLGKKEYPSLNIIDFSHVPEPELEEPKPVGKSFCHFSPQEQTAAFVKTQKRVAVHNARSTRRVIADNASALFQYQALAQNQQFMGFILIEDDVPDWPAVEEILFRPGLSIGKSRSAGYGQIAVEKIAFRGSQNWLQVEPPDLDKVLRDDVVVITLLSNALVRDDQGNFSADISYALNICPKKLQRQRSVIQSRIIGGFNRKWGLQIPQSLAVQMGSVFVYNRPDIDLDRLRQAQTGGLGERCNEGFGQIAINWHRYDRIKGTKSDLILPKGRYISLEPNSHSETLAYRILNYQLCRALDKALLEEIPELKIEPTTTRTQLARVRLMARHVLENPQTKDGVISVIDEFLAGIKDKPAHQMLERARVGETSLYAWLSKHRKPEQIKKTLRWQDSHTNSFRLANLKVTFTEKMQIEYTAKLIEGVMKRELDRQRNLELGRSGEEATGHAEG